MRRGYVGRDRVPIVTGILILLRAQADKCQFLEKFHMVSLFFADSAFSLGSDKDATGHVVFMQTLSRMPNAE
jgi:hypothetical protein